ncbi:TPA: hypothetical protein ACHWKL_003353 [Providencia stuartii]|nr:MULTISPECIES: hypothetical protein [Morganellaceae]AIO09866.2 hypothetical protein SEEHN418_00655 [Salmonella enterica subsp. enterica serovar Heidelberg str. N418]AIO10432.2 hypothetical protein JV44_00385 [Salmonella enterica subsp. enterica serovar Infantis]AIO10668.2 hypothetical protein JV41_00645 [Salmonella enterica subsp. enterica serovar Kentucky]AJB79688.1 hypothetical protein KU56_p01650 [Klebsiella pneumoniae]EAC2065229.1 hypothetical protein [Salmonella enterica subsp. enterica
MFVREPPARGAVIPQGLCRMLFVWGGQLPHYSLSTESKILLSEGHKLSHVKVDATGKAGG